MYQNDVQLNQCKLKSLDGKEARAFINKKLFHTDITAEKKKKKKKKKININELA